MNFKRSTMAAVIGSAFALGMSGQAAADLYAGSSLHIKDLSIFIGELTPGGFVPAPQNVRVTSFNFTLLNTAVLNGNLGGSTDTCSGTPGSNNCGPANGDGNDAPDTLYAGAANAPGGDVTRTNRDYAGADNTFEWYGQGAGTEWSNSDSIIHVSELTTGGTPTESDQITESRLSGGTDASASSEITSNTGFEFTFTVGGPNPSALLLNFRADPDMYAAIFNDAPNQAFSAGADVNVSFTLSKDGAFGVGAEWAPDGTGVNNCASGGGVACVELADSQSLNRNVVTTTDNTNDQFSYDPNVAALTPFGIFVNNLSAGRWSLRLQAKTSTSLNHTPVPEPGILSLLGIGLLGLGHSVRRRKAVA